MNTRKAANFAMLLVSACLAHAQGDLPNPAKYLGKTMPAFNMVKAGGGHLTNADLKGKVYIVDFWGTWCVTCRLMTHVMEGLYTKYHNKGLFVVGADAQEFKASAIQRELKFHPRPYVVTLNNDALADRMDAVAFPTVFVVDKLGTVRDVEVGVRKTSSSDLDHWVHKLLAEKA